MICVNIYKDEIWERQSWDMVHLVCMHPVISTGDCRHLNICLTEVFWSEREQKKQYTQYNPYSITQTCQEWMRDDSTCKKKSCTLFQNKMDTCQSKFGIYLFFIVAHHHLGHDILQKRHFVFGGVYFCCTIWLWLGTRFGTRLLLLRGRSR